MNCVLPGYIDSLNHKPEAAGKVGEIAKTAVFPLSDGAGYITGQNIRVDGGIIRHV